MNWHLCLQLILSLLFARAEDVQEDPYKIALEEIDMKISNTLHGITVKWRTPNQNRDPRCYKSEVQYRNKCVKEWTKHELTNEHRLTVLNLSTLSMKHSYDFRIRLKVDCIDGDWSNWTKVQSWGNNKGACGKVESSSNTWIYILITVLPAIIFLLICLLTGSIRKQILPVVPDAKHFKSKIMDIDQSQWWGSLGQFNEECTTTEIEIVDKSENNEYDQTVVIESMDATPEQHDSMYCIYSSETSDENTQAQCSQTVFGYIAL